MPRKPYVKNSPSYKTYGFCNARNGETGAAALTWSLTKHTLAGKSDQGEYYEEWRNAVSEGVNACTDRVASRWSFTPASGGYIWTRFPNGTLSGNFLHEFSGMLASYGNAASAANPNGRVSQPRGTSTLRNIALRRFTQDVQENVALIKSGVILGEARENARLLKTRGRTFRERLLNFMRDRIEDFKGRKPLPGSGQRRKTIIDSRLKEYADKWSTFAFGVKPLVSDMDDLAKALSASEPPSHLKVKGGAKEDIRLPPEFDVDTQELGVPSSNKDFCLHVTTIWWRAKMKYYGALNCEQPSGPFSQTATALGLGMADFLPTLYELIPYSFLLDYFTNVGSLIETKTQLSAHLAYANLSEKTDWNLQQEVRNALELKKALNNQNLGGMSTMIDAGGYGGTCNYRRETHWRTRNVQDLGQTFEVFLPPLDGLKWANMVALGLTHSKLKSVIHN